MTKEEAIARIKNFKEQCPEDWETAIEAFNMAIQALEQQPTKEEKALLQKWRDNRGISMKDFEDAMDALEKKPCPYWDYGLNTCRHANIGALATVTPNDVLEKIRAEIEKAMHSAQEDSRITQDDIDCGICAGIQRAIDIIDKYKADKE